MRISIDFTIFAFKSQFLNYGRFKSPQSGTCRKEKTIKWLAEELGRNHSTVSKWCTNVSQPDLYTLNRIAKPLDIEMSPLITCV